MTLDFYYSSETVGFKMQLARLSPAPYPSPHVHSFLLGQYYVR